MADNTVLNTGSGGDTIATDDIGGVKYARSKIVVGADGVNDGDVSSANPLPVTGTLTTVNTVTTLAGGGVAHDAADSGNPVKIGARAVSSEIAALAAGDRSDLLTDLAGKLLVRPHCNPENQVRGVASTTDTSDAAVIAAQGAGVRIYVTGLSIANSSATDAIVEIKSAGTVVWRTAAPQKGGSNIQFDPPLQLAANEALNMASLSAATTMYFSANGYKGA